MKKRFLSLLTAICLTLTLTPVAFAEEAQPDTITLPNGEVREIPNVDPNPIMAANISDLEVDKDGYYIIKDTNDLAKIAGNSPEWYANRKFKITGDIDMAPRYSANAEWTGYIQYFYGTMEGVLGYYDGKENPQRYPKIYNIPDNCAMIYAVIGGTIQNLTFEHKVNMETSEKGSASFITFMPSTLGGVGYHLTMKNVTTTGKISLTGSDQSNYAPFVYCAPKGGITMENCVNDADITGNIYGSVFHGYYPLYTGADCKYKFIDCVNNKNVTMQYAGMFFGNSSSIEGKVGSLYLNVTRCKNNGEIRGTSGAKLFAAPVSEFGSNMENVEIFLSSNSTVAQPAYMTLEHVDGNAPCIGEKLNNFGVAVNGNDIVITRPENETAVDHYVVSVNAYVNLWYPAINSFYGSDRVTVSEKISTEDLPAGNIKPDLKAYGFADTGVGTLAGISGDYFVYQYNDAYYYWVSNTEMDSGFARYVSSETGTDGKPVGGGTMAADYVTVVAYGDGGAILDSVTVTLP